MQKNLKNFFSYIKAQIFLISSDYITFWILTFIFKFENFHSYLFSKILFTSIGYFFYKYLIFKSSRKVLIRYIIIILGNIVFSTLLISYIENYIEQDLILKFTIDVFLFFLNYVLLKNIFQSKY